MQHLQSRSAGGHWVLKAPDHVFALDALQEVYPDARFVFVHRDPMRVVASVARLTQLLRTPFARYVSPTRTGREVTEDWACAAAIMVELDSRQLIDPARVVHVLYSDLVARPLATVERIYGHFGLTLAPVAAKAMRRLVAADPRGGYGRNYYNLADYGIDPEEIRDSFDDYVLCLGVPAELGQAKSTTA
ncbi:MAG: sulfotransferase family protein [Acidimicrobiales bacterium]